MENKNDLETAIEEIDSALLRLSKAPQEGYVFFDFEDPIQHILSLMPAESKNYINRLKVFYFVFKDLLYEVVDWSMVEEVDEKNHSMTWKTYRHERNRRYHIVGGQTVKYEKDEFEKNRAIWEVGYKTADIRRSKFNILFEKVSYKPEGNELAYRQMEINALHQCIKLIERAGFNFRRDSSLTFEKYVRWKETSPSSQGVSVDEVTGPSGDIKIKWKGGPALLGYLMDELDRNGYLTLPYGTNKEKNADYLLKIFDLKTTVKTLAIELSENTNSLIDANKRIDIKPILKSKK